MTTPDEDDIQTVAAADGFGDATGSTGTQADTDAQEGNPDP
ncbi:hypothetical protein [Nocardia carnea]|nr:hypothetical protein [Nocardia carnea]